MKSSLIIFLCLGLAPMSWSQGAANPQELAAEFERILIWSDIRESAFGGDFQNLSESSQKKLVTMVDDMTFLLDIDLDEIRAAIDIYLRENSSVTFESYYKRINIVAVLYFLFDVPSDSGGLYIYHKGDLVLQPMAMMRTSIEEPDYLGLFDRIRSRYPRRIIN